MYSPFDVASSTYIDLQLHRPPLQLGVYGNVRCQANPMLRSCTAKSHSIALLMVVRQVCTYTARVIISAGQAIQFKGNSA